MSYIGRGVRWIAWKESCRSVCSHFRRLYREIICMWIKRNIYSGWSIMVSHIFSAAPAGLERAFFYPRCGPTGRAGKNSFADLPLKNWKKRRANPGSRIRFSILISTEMTIRGNLPWKMFWKRIFPTGRMSTVLSGRIQPADPWLCGFRIC